MLHGTVAAIGRNKGFVAICADMGDYLVLENINGIDIDLHDQIIAHCELHCHGDVTVENINKYDRSEFYAQSWCNRETAMQLVNS
jgi:hypothetical protein